MIKTLTVTTLLIVSILLPLQGQEAQRINWPDLAPVVEFEDPFEALPSNQLQSLSIVARIQEMQKSSPEKVSAGMLEEYEENLQKLKEEDVDIEYLFSKRQEIKELRSNAARTLNNSLMGKFCQMSGFLLPLEVDAGMTSEFLLVPWVGACIHTPPPPPNQIVYVSLQKPTKVRSQFQPIQVIGIMEPGLNSKNLYLVDGSADIPVGYTMRGFEILEM
jgi:hypothetical protein